MKFFKRLLTAPKNAGFTLIELLVVIGILGILASALVATIDPFEQLKKANDANAKNTAVEFLNANIRYYTTHNSLPWSNTSDANYTACNAAVTGAATGTGVNLSSVATTSCIASLITDGELKAGFTTVTSVLSSIYFRGASNGVTVCFLPQSRAQKADANTKYNQDGSATIAAPTCPNATSTGCYWCSQ